jgi:hypothetical protein
MKRWTIRILVVLLLGAIVNVAVASVATWRQSFRNWTGYLAMPSSLDDDRVVGVAGVTNGWGHSRISICATSRVNGAFIIVDDLNPIIADWAKAHLLRHKLVPNSGDEVTAYAAGWPVLSMTGDLFLSSDRRDHHWVVTHTVTDRRGQRQQRILPLRPLWPGFAVNTVFYAGILSGRWLLFAAPFALRKWRRIRRGLCSKCGYDLRGGGGRNRPNDSAVCPECGATR